MTIARAGSAAVAASAVATHREPTEQRAAGAATGAYLPRYEEELNRDELVRYSRHLLLPDVGVTGQRRLKGARVLIVGAGGLGSPSSLYLAAAGVGTIGIVDFDTVDVSNLQRQIVHGESDVGRPKIASARDRLREVNPHVHVEGFQVPFTAENALEIARDFDVIVDGTDNFATRYLTNDTAVLLGKPNVYGSIFRFEGQASLFATADGPCYRCLFPEPPPPGLVPSCAEGGVLGVLPGLIGTIQATETIKLILGAGRTLAGRLLLVDTLDLRFRTVNVRRDPTCPACGTRELRELVDYEQFCGAPLPHRESAGGAGSDRVVNGVPQLDPLQLKRRLDAGDDISILDVREEFEWQICRLPGAVLVPLGELPERVGELDGTREVVVQCKSGRRSQQGAELLRAAGFARVWNLAGGILAWGREVDPELPQY